ncbi:uncharacterized protein LOC124490196 [Dermatophagoides farinae]|nr:cilia- and flagella-associated protein 36-like [Dermatophagoides farinae]XP_046908613.1 cilia- and flagella-associated protein 36-like [Dermatophagoides farinae]KAH9517589.1 Cilia- and flagella-associated protein 36 [Dermatophagoides farinae]
MSLENTNQEDNEDQTWVLDSLVGFLKSPLWSTSLNDFIDRHSIIFDPDEIENDDGNVHHHTEYLEIFYQYRRLVDQLIGSHMLELGINEQQFAKACQMAEGMLATKLKRILFEELWAAEDYEVFVRLMAKRNVELQLEALEVLVRKYGLVYDVFVPVGTSPKNFLSEDHVLREAIVRSLNDMALDNENKEIKDNKKSSSHGKIIKKNVEVDIETKTSISDDTPEAKNEENEDDDVENEVMDETTDKETVQRDAVRLVEVKQKFDQKMTEALQSAFMNDKTKESMVDNRDQPLETVQESNEPTKDSSIIIKRREPSISAEDIHKRADYLRAQRDKILKQRQKERTERISKYLIKEKQQRPVTARKSPTEMEESNTNQNDTTDDMLAFRKSLAARLKAEVVLGSGTGPESK